MSNLFDPSWFSTKLTAIEECKPFTIEDFYRTIEWMKNRRTELPYFLIAPETAWQLRRLTRISKLYQANPLPRRKLRKCIERRILARRAKGRRRIERLERSSRDLETYKAIP